MARRQLIGLGWGRSRIEAALGRGDLIAVHRGVYRVGHRAPSVEASYAAALLACGPGSLISGRAAAYLHRLIRGSPPPPEVTTPRNRRVAGVRTRRTRTSQASDRCLVRWIPTTTVARTLVDLAPVLPVGALAHAVHEAQAIHRTTPTDVETVLARRPSSTATATTPRDTRWERDRMREREARARGDDFRRFAYDDVFERPQALIEELEPLLR